MRGWCSGFASCLWLAACLPAEMTPAEPKQQDTHPMAARGEKSFAQRQRDCWDMPSAPACYEVGLKFELGLVGKPDPKQAFDYYLKACEIGSEAEHCEAAKRLESQGR